jgi:two-component system cell cycle sensor histidine kinase/response regulator CckA
VIADVVMPGMGGKHLAEALDARWPGLPVLFISGYPGLEAVRRGLMDADEEFMPKPLEPDTVVRRVRQVLDARKV